MTSLITIVVTNVEGPRVPALRCTALLRQNGDEGLPPPFELSAPHCARGSRLYLRADAAHATSVGQVDVICAGLAARCVQHSGGETGASEALLAASATYAVFFTATIALAVGLGSAAEMAQHLRDLITAQARPFERSGASVGVSL